MADIKFGKVHGEKKELGLILESLQTKLQQ